MNQTALIHSIWLIEVIAGVELLREGPADNIPLLAGT
jgi:hypothetical protein